MLSLLLQLVPTFQPCKSLSLLNSTKLKVLCSSIAVKNCLCWYTPPTHTQTHKTSHRHFQRNSFKMWLKCRISSLTNLTPHHTSCTPVHPVHLIWPTCLNMPFLCLPGPWSIHFKLVHITYLPVSCYMTIFPIRLLAPGNRNCVICFYILNGRDRRFTIYAERKKRTSEKILKMSLSVH
jgi:hypothetical protein